MTHWKLTLSYDGTGFHGWQVQPGLITVQGTLAGALEHVTGEKLLPQGSGRTDAGVHAMAQVASFSLEISIPPENLLRALNRSLPASVRVLQAETVTPDFHARHSATGKTYEYRIFHARRPAGTSDPGKGICPPFLAPYAWDCRWSLDIDSMNLAAARLIGEHDFASFAASDPDRTSRNAGSASPLSTVRTVWASFCSREDDLLVYRISGSGFLHNMVRNIVGTLVEVGRGSLAPSCIGHIVSARDRAAAGPTAPAQGLFLLRVEYERPVR